MIYLINDIPYIYHTHTHVCMCVCIYHIPYIYIYKSVLYLGHYNNTCETANFLKIKMYLLYKLKDWKQAVQGLYCDCRWWVSDRAVWLQWPMWNTILTTSSRRDWRQLNAFFNSHPYQGLCPVQYSVWILLWKMSQSLHCIFSIQSCLHYVLLMLKI